LWAARRRLGTNQFIIDRLAELADQSCDQFACLSYARNVLSEHKTQSGVLRSLRGKSGKYSQLHRFLNGVQLRFKLIVATGDPAGVSRKS
jgi:hypothetical protein